MTSKSNSNSLKEITNALSESLKVRTSHYVITAGALVVGMAWNEAIKKGIQHVYPGVTGEGVRAAFTYAIVLTLVLVLVIHVLPDTKEVLPTETRDKLERMKFQNQDQNKNQS